ncbi:MAG: hypothetical protein LH478_09455 [Chitinophagaceae bacterium]|nr:hypothetical protein [Chitinophagaceae bacterium]
MKKYLLAVVFFTASYVAQSQDLKSISINVALKKFDDAKSDLDKFLAVEKNAAKPEGWYYKAYIYNMVARDSKKTVAESKSLNDEAFAALKKYAQIDAKVPLTKEENNSTLFNLYYSYYDMGVKMYNEKKYPESFDLFRNSLEVHDYGIANSLSGPGTIKFSVHDTDLVWNLAVLANELKKKDDAVIYYKKIADANLGDEKYATAYDELVQKYKREKNAELFKKYVTAAKKYYPVDLPYWENKETEFALAGLENDALLNKYEELITTFPNNYLVFYNYAVEVDKFLGTDAAKSKDAAAVAAYRTKIEDLFKKAVLIKPNIEGNLQLANLYYSKTYELQERAAKIKGTKPAEIKVKNELTASVKTTMNQAIPFAEDAVKLLAELKDYKFTDKANYKLALEILSNAYKMNGNTAKHAEIEKRRVEVEKL